MTIYDARRTNLRTLMDSLYGLGARGAQTRLAEALGKSQNYLSRCLADPGSTGARNIGEQLAREIETTFNLPPYLMDSPSFQDFIKGRIDRNEAFDAVTSDRSFALTDRSKIHTLPGASVPTTTIHMATAGVTHEGDPQDCQPQLTLEPLRVVTSRVPVVGKAMLGKDGYFDALDYPAGHGDGYLAVPSDDPDAYALRVVGNSMLPRIKSGEYVLIEPAQAYTNGDDVLVRTRDGRAMIKEFVYLRDGQYRFDSYSADHDPVYLDESEVVHIHFVGGIFKSYRHTPD